MSEKMMPVTRCTRETYLANAKWVEKITTEEGWTEFQQAFGVGIPAIMKLEIVVLADAVKRCIDDYTKANWGKRPKDENELFKVVKEYEYAEDALEDYLSQVMGEEYIKDRYRPLNKYHEGWLKTFCIAEMENTIKRRNANENHLNKMMEEGDHSRFDEVYTNNITFVLCNGENLTKHPKELEEIGLGGFEEIRKELVKKALAKCIEHDKEIDDATFYLRLIQCSEDKKQYGLGCAEIMINLTMPEGHEYRFIQVEGVRHYGGKVIVKVRGNKSPRKAKSGWRMVKGGVF